MTTVDTLCPGTLCNTSRQTMPAITMCTIRVGASRQTSRSHSLLSGTDFSARSGPAETSLPATSALVSLQRRLSILKTRRPQSHTPTPQTALPKIQSPTKTISETLLIYHRYPSKIANLSLQPEKPNSKQQAHGSKSLMTKRTAAQVC